jgi:hypothetical protein
LEAEAKDASSRDAGPAKASAPHPSPRLGVGGESRAQGRSAMAAMMMPAGESRSPRARCGV